MAQLGQAVVEIRADTNAFKAALSAAERETRGFANRAGAAAASMGRAFSVAAAALTAVGIGALASQVVRTTAEFEKLQASLRTVTGSAEAGKAAFAVIRDFAKTTPFDLQQTTQAFIRLKSLGLDPSRAALESYGNTASAMGKSLIDFIEAIADASTGEFERLKEFGIRASSDANKVTFTFQGVSTTIGKNAKEIEAYLRRIGTTTFAGAMVEQSKTLGGALSNLGDSISQFQFAIGQGGLGKAVAEAAREMSNFLDANEKAANQIGAGLGRAVESATQAFRDFRDETEDTFFGNVSEGISVLANAIHTAETYVVAFGRAYAGAFDAAGSATQGLIPQIIAFAQEAFSGVAQWGPAIVSLWSSTLNAVAAIFVSGYQVATIAWGQLPNAFRDLGTRAANALITAINGAIGGIAGSLNALIDSLNGLGANIPRVEPPSFAPIENEAAGAAERIAKQMTDAIDRAFSTDFLGQGAEAAKREFDRIKGLAEEYRKAQAAKRQLAAASAVSAPAAAAGALPTTAAGGATSSGSGSGGALSDSEFTKATRAARDRINDLQAEIATFNMAKGASAAYRLEQELLAAAAERGSELTAKQRQEIAQLASAYGQATDQLSRLKLAQDLAFDAAQAGRSRSEREVYSQLQSAGQLTNGEIATPEARASADSIRATQTFAAQTDLVRELNFETQQLARTESERTVYSRMQSAGLLDQYGQITGEINTQIAAQLRLNQAISEAQQAVRGLGAEMIRGGLEGGAKGVFAAVSERLQNTMIERAGAQIDNMLMSGISSMMGGPTTALGAAFAPKRDGSSAASALYVVPVSLEQSLTAAANPLAAFAPGLIPANSNVPSLLSTFTGATPTAVPAAPATATALLAASGGVPSGATNPNWLAYANQGAVRNQPLSPELAQKLSYLGDMGLTAKVFSGGQTASRDPRLKNVPGGWTGATNHNHGNAADVEFYRGDQKLDWANPADRPIFEEIVSRGRANGVTSFGAGPGYMRPGSMHVGLGADRIWGADKTSASAPGWLRDAYNRPISASPGVTALGAATALPEIQVNGAQQSINALQTSTQQAAAAIPTMTTSATAAAPALGGVAQQSTGLVGAFQSIMGGISQIGLGAAKGVGSMLGLGFSEGGYTGDMGRGAVAGVVHGQEFVAHAEATRRWRPMLEVMNAGGDPRIRVPAPVAPGYAPQARGGNVNVRVINNSSGQARVEERDDGRGGRSIDVIVDEVVARNNRTPGTASARSLSERGARPRLQKLG